jgi:serine/threonine protein kinase
MNKQQDLSELPISSLKMIAKKFGIKITHCKNKNEITKVLQTFYDDIQKFHDYSYIKQLGSQGKDGRTFKARHVNGNEYAVKIFKKSKNSKRIRKEVDIQQHAAEFGVSVPVFDWSDTSKYVSMDILDKTLFDYFIEQNGELTIKQQQDVISLLQRMDDAGVFHADPNPLNFMYKKKKLYLIDFGFSSFIDKKCVTKYGATPNMKYMPLGLIIHLKKINPDTKLTHLYKHVDPSLLSN